MSILDIRYAKLATSLELASKNPVIALGQLAVETDTGKIKLGDGLAKYKALPWFYGGTTRTYKGQAADQAAMLALSGYAGDWVTRTDLGGRVFELTALPASTVSNWVAYPAGDTSSAVPTLIPYSPVIDLTHAGEGAYSVGNTGSTVFPNPIQITTNTVLSVAPNPVYGGGWSAVLAADGSHTLNYSGFTVVGDTFNPAVAGRQYLVAAMYLGGVPVLRILDTGGTADTTPPTVTVRAVANASPTVINLTFSEPIKPTMPAFGSFAVDAGHTVTAIAYVDSTHVNLTVTPAFAAGETRTLSYTQPGTNNIQDLAGNAMANFGGQAIADNVTGGSGILSHATVALTVEDLTALGYTDYQVYATNSSNDVRKNTTATITGPTAGGGAARAAGSGSMTGLTWSDATGTGSGVPSNTSSEVGIWAMTAGGGTVSWTIPVGTTQIKVRLRSSQYIPTSGTPVLIATLSDGSATALSWSPTFSIGNTPQADEFEEEITVKAASAGQSVTITHSITGSLTFAQIYPVGIWYK